MDLSEYRAGVFEHQLEYQSFLPRPINHAWIIGDSKTQFNLDEASRLIGELNAYSQLVPDVDYFLRLHIAKEATTSSRIEGTRTNMEEAMANELDLEPEQRDDWQEVQNYIQAMNNSLENMNQMPLSNRLLKNAHGILMKGVRGMHKQPGEFRTSQNWIGISLKNATFVPPHPKHIVEMMSDMEKFIHNENIHVPHLLKAAILHYQFETIHPFLDGNGRLGRLLITLYLVHSGLLSKPSLYLSDFLEKHKAEYYDHLMAVRKSNKLSAWVNFFLIGVKETAENSISVFKAIIALRANLEKDKLPLVHNRKKKNALHLMNYLYRSPIVSPQEVSRQLSIRHNTATALVKDFEKLGILREMTGQKRNRLYKFSDYIQLFR